MTDQQDPVIGPPWQLMRQWREQAPNYRDGGVGREKWLIDRAAQWGYEQRGEVNEAKLQQARDQELEACAAWFDKHIPGYELVADRLRAARRPKPPTLKEQGLQALEALQQRTTDPSIIGPLRCALEALPYD